MVRLETILPPKPIVRERKEPTEEELERYREQEAMEPELDDMDD